MRARPDARRYLGAAPAECCVSFFFICFTTTCHCYVCGIGDWCLFSFYRALTAPRAGRVLISSETSAQRDAMQRDSSEEPLRLIKSLDMPFQHPNLRLRYDMSSMWRRHICRTRPISAARRAEWIVPPTEPRVATRRRWRQP